MQRPRRGQTGRRLLHRSRIRRCQNRCREKGGASYYVAPTKEVTRLVEDLPNPNGIILSPDEKILFVIPSGQADILAYDVTAPGKIGDGRVFASLSQPEGTSSGGDGCTIDTDGNLYVTSDLGIQIFSPAGERIEIVSLPEVPRTVTFGGPGNRMLTITAETSLYRIATNRVGHVFGP